MGSRWDSFQDCRRGRRVRGIDALITEVFVQRKFSDYVIISQPNDEEVVLWIEEHIGPNFGSVDDSAPLFLAERFAQMRQEYISVVPEYPWCGPCELEPVSGEIPWRQLHEEPCQLCGHAAALHGDQRCTATLDDPAGCPCKELLQFGFPCRECGHLPGSHVDLDELYCTEPSCNCGYHTGR